MKAIIYEEYGGPEVFQLKDLEKPVPKDSEILVKVYASSVPAAVLWARTGKHPTSKFFTLAVRLMFGITKPRKKILGYEFSGEVEAVGKDVKRFQKGDQVVGTTTGLNNGAYAEYICIPEEWKQGVVATKHPNITYEDAAAIPVAGMAALHILNSVTIQKGQKVLIFGASGSLGTFAAQIAKSFGAEVTGVCSTAKTEVLKSIGIDKVIDYKKEDFTQDGEIYDVIFDIVGKLSKSQCKASLQKNGVFLTSKSPTKEKSEYLVFLQELIEAGKLKVVVDQVFPLEKMVEAHRYVDSGQKKGNVVITINHKDKL